MPIVDGSLEHRSISGAFHRRRMSACVHEFRASMACMVDAKDMHNAFGEPFKLFTYTLIG